ncbi:unnamed protein product [Ambrosiozyma monospora]|uniref:Unnamed protein product n=1 Tax=Ambrosiozyma monospora TaxID=43982 RepID=A0ACB5SX81_AMBMO|nr:unnamed protein product [Ambrosiozyma monospora]
MMQQMQNPNVKLHLFQVRGYNVHSIIGEGAYGVVAQAYSTQTIQRVAINQRVAIKKILPFSHELNSIRTLREIKFLKKFNHENIISILDLPKPPDFESFREIYLVQEFMETDLHHVIATQPLSNDHVQYLLYQILKGVKYLHSGGVIHRDLKPSNLLVNSNCDLKICDFGLARLDSENSKESREACLSEYVATRYYRAPEVMLSTSQYSKAIDMWSVGCILAEMFLRTPLLPGKDYVNQVQLIFELLGTPRGEEVNCVKSRKAREYIKRCRTFKRIPFKKIFRQVDPDAIDLLEKLLTFDPALRITAEQSLEHPYVEVYRNPEEEISCSPFPKDAFYFDEIKDSLKMLDMKRLIYTEVINQKT